MVAPEVSFVRWISSEGCGRRDSYLTSPTSPYQFLKLEPRTPPGRGRSATLPVISEESYVHSMYSGTVNLPVTIAPPSYRTMLLAWGIRAGVLSGIITLRPNKTHPGPLRPSGKLSVCVC